MASKTLRLLFDPTSPMRTVQTCALALVLSLASLATSCGGGGIAAKDMVLLELQYLDRALTPAAPTGTASLPRNALVGLVFSELVNPHSVSPQTVQIRFGPGFQSVPAGSFQVSGNRVLFDPTLTGDGQPNPGGFQPVTQYTIRLPAEGEQSSVLENLDEDPNLRAFFTQFTTAEGWLRDLTPPRLLRIHWAPDVDELTGQVPGNGLMGFEFDEAMDPGSFVQGRAADGGSVDIRYVDDSGPNGINAQNGLADTEIDGSFSPNPDWRIFWFKPLFSFGDKKFIFAAQVFQGLQDLSGNLLSNPASYGPFTCDALGITAGKTIKEDFLTTVNQDAAASDADWGDAEDSLLVGVPVTSRRAELYSYVETDNGTGDGMGGRGSDRGQYAPLAEPLIGASLNQINPNINPATSVGRRVMWSFPASVIGERGSVTGVAWGPDSNATFAASYANVKLRIGYQRSDQLSLASTFSGNYVGQPAVIYDGSYLVQQSADVGNTPGQPAWQPLGGQQGGGCVNPAVAHWNDPLFASTGWYDWPELTTYFEWDPQGDPAKSKKVLVFDASVTEGDTHQQVRGWLGMTFPCSGTPIPSRPFTRMYAGYEADDPNPAPNPAFGILNPEPATSDTRFTITRQTSIAQSKFFGPGQGDNTTFGDLTDYGPAILTPAIQPGGARVEVEYQGADSFNVDPNGNEVVNQAGSFTADPVTGEPTWVKDVNQCDGMRNIRFRLRLIANLTSLVVPRVDKVVIPMTSD